MRRRPEAARILAMHPPDLAVSIDKLACFLCGWLGGPKRYGEKYGSIRLPQAHQHLPIHPVDRDEWLTCMEIAIAQQPYAADFRDYLLAQLRVPAERVLRVCSEAQSQPPR